MTSECTWNSSMPQLREAFVRGRFAEPQAFGRPDAENWLASQRQAAEPDEGDNSPWIEDPILQEIPEKDALAILGRYGASVGELTPELAQDTLQRKLIQEFAGLWQGFDCCRVRWYLGRGQGPVVTIAQADRTHHQGYVFNARSEGGLEVAPLNNIYVVTPLLATWRWGGTKGQEAREFLCGLMAQAIAKVRAPAEADFGNAIAVNADGTEIIRAHDVARVLVYGDTGIPQEFPATAFTPPQHKIYRCAGKKQSMTRFWRNDFQRFSVGLVQAMREEHCGPQALVCTAARNGLVFVTHERFCPKPLPELTQEGGAA